jgi:hypothetical protein
MTTMTTKRTMTSSRGATTMATTTEPHLRAVLLVGAALFAALAIAFLTRDDDRPVDPRRPDAQRAIATARAIVTGELVDVRIDTDNGKWEVTLRRNDGGEHEVELSPQLELLRIDYD